MCEICAAAQVRPTVPGLDVARLSLLLGTGPPRVELPLLCDQQRANFETLVDRSTE